MKRIKDKVYDIAKYYSPKVGLDLPYFIKGGFWLSVGQFFSLLKAFILSLLFANFLPKEIFGQYTFVMSILGVIAIFSLPGMVSAIIHAVARGKEGTYFKALKLVFKWSWLGSLSLVIVALYGKLVGREYGSLIFLILASIYPFYAISIHYIDFFNGKKMFDLQVKLSSIFSIISMIFIALTIFLTGSVFWIVLVTVLIQIFIQGYFSLILVKKYMENKKVSKQDLDFGKKTSFSLALYTIAEKIDNLILTFFLGFENLAIYTIVILLPNQLKTLSKTFTPLLLPKLAKQNVNKKQIMSHFWKLLLVCIGLIILYTLFAPFIFKWFYPKYSNFVLLSIIFNFSFIVFSSIIFQNYLIKLRRTKELNKIFNLSSIYLILGSFILIYFFGLIGAVINRILYRIIYFVLFLLAVKKE